MAMLYSNTGYTEEIQNIAERHRRRPEFCALNGMTAGGKAHFNVHERNIWYELQRRELSENGVVVPVLSVHYGGRKCVCHDLTARRNELFAVLDHPEKAKQAGEKGQRCPAALKPVFINYNGISGSNRSVCSFFHNPDVEVRDRNSATLMKQKAEEVRGTPAWDVLSKETGDHGFVDNEW